MNCTSLRLTCYESNKFRVVANRDCAGNRLMTAERPKSTGSGLDPEQWVDRHGDYLFRFALSRLGNREAAEDLIQETFLAALCSWKNFAARHFLLTDATPLTPQCLS